MDWIEKDGKLTRTLKFESQTQMMEFLLKVAQESDAMNHHPDITIRKAFECHLSLETHDERKITDKDYILATKINGLLLVK